MNLLTAKTTLHKIWTWLKHYWYIPAILVYSIVLAVVFRRNSLAAIEILGTTKDSYQKQIDVINTVHKNEIVKRDKIISQYNAVIENLEKNYQAEVAGLDATKKRRVKELVDSYHDKPEELTKMLGASFGINYVD